MKGSLLLFNLKLNCLIFFYQSKQLADNIYADICCKLSKCVGQTPCSYEHYLVVKWYYLCQQWYLFQQYYSLLFIYCCCRVCNLWWCE